MEKKSKTDGKKLLDRRRKISTPTEKNFQTDGEKFPDRWRKISILIEIKIYPDRVFVLFPLS
ncbi:hypothetical protein ACFFUE_00100 [Bergeyella porcorum]|uniref:hypothetical protein n=1 Tax=Bergeyella porcorum TaxID=1735111 RepID=UPI0035E9370A